MYDLRLHLHALSDHVSPVVPAEAVRVVPVSVDVEMKITKRDSGGGVTLGETPVGYVVTCGGGSGLYLRVYGGYVDLEALSFVNVGPGNEHFPVTVIYDAEIILTQRRWHPVK